jgi:hypothetical protein
MTLARKRDSRTFEDGCTSQHHSNHNGVQLCLHRLFQGIAKAIVFSFSGRLPTDRERVSLIASVCQQRSPPQRRAKSFYDCTQFLLCVASTVERQPENTSKGRPSRGKLHEGHCTKASRESSTHDRDLCRIWCHTRSDQRMYQAGRIQDSTSTGQEGRNTHRRERCTPRRGRRVVV